MLFFVCLFIPLIGTVLGAFAVFLIGRNENHAITASLDGLAAGVMTASAIFSLLLPAFEVAKTPYLPLGGLLVGFIFFFAVAILAERCFDLKKAPTLANFAITLHNLPEGMAVGIALAGLFLGVEGMAAGSVLALAVGIAIQNIPEGAIVSLPASARGRGKGYAFGVGVLSGVVEPIGALLALFLSEIAAVLLPFFLAFAAAAMLSVVTGELSESFRGERGRYGQAFFAIGFVLMTSLDVIFS